MTQLLNNAFSEASKLPESENVLEKLAHEALMEHEKGFVVLR